MKFLLFIFSVISISMSVAHAQDSRRLKRANHPPATRKDSIKYFPKLLGDSMSINFDPNKYLPRSTQATTAPASITVLPTPVKDTTPAAITQRTNNLVTTYHVSSPHI